MNNNNETNMALVNKCPIVVDFEEITNINITKKTCNKKKEPKTIKEPKPSLKLVYNERNRFEIGIDEAGRGPMFGRLYVAGVILPKDGSIDHSFIRDSKKLTAKKRNEMSDYIKKHALTYHIHFVEPNVIDKINIRQAVLQAMKECIIQCRKQILKQKGLTTEYHHYDHDVFALVDGADFAPCMNYDDTNGEYKEIPHATCVGGDNEYMAIAAASILAKVARDDYILQLCTKHPELVTKYGMDTHMGYGTKKHLEGIMKHGITQYHRRTYGCCKNAKVSYSFVTADKM
jgi:ribonuclease HII